MKTRNSIKIRPVLILLLAAMLLCGTTAVSFAADDTQARYTYTVTNHSVTITGYLASDSTTRIPPQICGAPVNTIAAGAFASTKASKVYVPDSVTDIEPGAFASGTELIQYYPVPDDSNMDVLEGSKTNPKFASGNGDDSITSGIKVTNTTVVDNGGSIPAGTETASLSGAEKTGEISAEAQGAETAYIDLSSPEDESAIGLTQILIGAAVFLALLLAAVIALYLRRNKQNS